MIQENQEILQSQDALKVLPLHWHNELRFFVNMMLFVFSFSWQNEVASRELECKQLQTMQAEAKKSLLDLAEKYQELLNQYEETQRELTEIKTKYADKSNQSEAEKQTFETRLAEFVQNEKSLSIQVWFVNKNVSNI